MERALKRLISHGLQHAVADEHARRLGEGMLGGVRHHGAVGCRFLLLLQYDGVRETQKIVQHFKWEVGNLLMHFKL